MAENKLGRIAAITGFNKTDFQNILGWSQTTLDKWSKNSSSVSSATRDGIQRQLDILDRMRVRLHSNPTSGLPKEYRRLTIFASVYFASKRDCIDIVRNELFYRLENPDKVKYPKGSGQIARIARES